MKVAVVILNWNGRSLLESFLPSVLQYSKEATIYLADNDSTDDSVSYVSNNYPEIRIIQNSVNGGYAKGYNDALSSLDEDLFVLLNSDVEVTSNWLFPIISEFENDPLLWAAQPKILDYHRRDYFEYAGAAGGYIDSFGYPFCRGRIFSSIEKDHNQYDDIEEIFWASGACLFVRKDIFWQLGGLDEDFFTHQEEIDLCWRIKTMGGSVKYFGNSTIYHVGGATLEASNPRKTFYNFRNTLLMLLKNVKGFKIFWVLFVRLLLDGVAGLRFLFLGKPIHLLAIIKAHFSFYGLIPKFLKKRKKNASSLKYAKVLSIVWNHYVKKNRNFNRPK